jgi:polyisoprenyl-teichoic acid--peptidoglycan teichoic acid transferase
MRPGGQSKTDRSTGRAPVGTGPSARAKAKASGRRPARKKHASVPGWARICCVVGAILMVVSGGLLISVEALLARYEGAVTTENLFGDSDTQAERVSDISGPLNILLVGIDPRDDTTLPLADSIMVMHVPAGLDRGYLFSLPRDLIVDIPAFEKAGFRGDRDRLNAAMALGSRRPGRLPDRAQGFELLSKTISAYTGIQRFDAGAIINFSGFRAIVDAMGGVTMYIDQNVKSEHMRPDAKHRPSNNCGCPHPYTGPQAEYTIGTHHLEGWQALDYVRQRYGLPKADYDRQRHQQQFVRAMVKQALSKDVISNPITLDKVLRAAGKSLVFSGRGHSVADFGFALRGLREDTIMMIKLEGGSITENGKYHGEQLKPTATDFFASLQDGTTDAFVAANPRLVNAAK